MKKLFVLVFAVVAFMVVVPQKVEAAYSEGYALGVGFNYNCVGSHAMGLYINGKTSWLPIMMGLSMDFAEMFSLNFSGDYWAWNPNLVSKEKFDLDFYLGIGNTFSYDNYEKEDYFNIKLSGRVTLGFSWRIAKKFEIFTEGVIGVHLLNYASAHNLFDEDYTGTALEFDKDTTYFKILGFYVNDIDAINEENGYTSDKKITHWDNLWHLFSFGANIGFRYWF